MIKPQTLNDIILRYSDKYMMWISANMATN